MKRSVCILLLCGLALASFGQTTYYHSATEHYRVSSDLSEAHATEVAKKMESALTLFNSILHFDISAMQSQMKVTIFETKDAFDDYLENTIGKTRKGFAYIHYSDMSKSELVGFKREQQTLFDSSLIRQGLIQFLQAFIPSPPVWIREGSAAYFEGARWNEETESFVFRPNLIWLSSLKSIIKGDEKMPLLLAEMLFMDTESVESKINTFYPQAWGMVSFLIDSDIKSYNRIFWDSLSSLSSSSTEKENSQSVADKAFKWVNQIKLRNDFNSYLADLKTFNELITDGVSEYSRGDISSAASIFLKAMVLESKSYIPFYYLGLISYDQKDYVQAETHYTKAMSFGAEQSLTNYALGVNAFAANRFNQAVNYLTIAKQDNPADYGDKVDSLLRRIETLR